MPEVMPVARTTSSAPVVGVLLAAGAGRRYGGPKVLAEAGAWLRAGVAALAGGGCAPVLVVLGAAVVPVPPPARAVINGDWAQGMGSSVRCGLAAARESGAELAVFHLVDLPGVGAEVVARVVSAAAETGLARATYGGLPGHPVAVAARYWPQLELASTGDRGGRAWLTGHQGLRLVPADDVADGRDRDTRSPVN